MYVSPCALQEVALFHAPPHGPPSHKGMTARLLVAESLPRLIEDALLPQSAGEDDAEEPAMLSIAADHVMLSGIIYGFEETSDRMMTRTTMDGGRRLISRLAANRPTPRQAKSGGVGENKRKRTPGSFAPSLQQCSLRNQRQDAFGVHTRSVHEESMRAASVYTQGQHPRVAEATMHLEFRDPARGQRLTRRVPMWMSVDSFGSASFPAASRPCFSSFDVPGSKVVSDVLMDEASNDPPSTLLRRGAAAKVPHAHACVCACHHVCHVCMCMLACSM